jgi:KaiC/GvpD/RAD55 family RecA-like ATPase
VIHVGVNAVGTAFSDDAYVRKNVRTAQKIGGFAGSPRLEADTSIVRLARENSTETYQGGFQTLDVSASASSSAAINHVMCKDYTPNGAPVDLTTIFSPGDEKAVCLVTSPINGSVEFRWYYRNDMSKTWVYCYSCVATVINMGCEGHLFIAGHELYCPRAYKVDAYLNGYFSFSDFFEITNGGLESPRTCEGVDTNGHPINMKSRFTVGVDSNVYYYLRFDKIAYFNEELGCSHNFTTVWIQPDGSVYETYSGNFTDYKDVNVAWNCWEYNYATDDYMPINSSTPIGNWKVEVYLDSYFNGTSMPYGPVATTPFVVANKPVADWTFMVYLDADYPGGNQNDSAGIDTFLNISEVGSSSQVNVVVQMDRISGWWNNGVWTSDARFDNWTDCKRFYVTTNMTPTAGNAISDLGEVDMGDPATLRDFVNWTINSYPANRYCLVLWNHGAGFVGLCIDSTNNDFLSMSKLSQALDGLPVIIDVIFNDACSMSMTEVAYQIKDYAAIMVGPEGLGYSPGAYNWYLAALTGNPSMMPSELATQMVSDYIAWCNYERQIYSQQDLPQVIQNATMSAIDLTRITSLSAAIDDFAMELKNKETLYNQQICWARNQTEEYPGPYEGDTGCYVDLYHFARLINASTYQNAVDKELRNTAGHVMTAINESMIIAENILLPNSHGLAIFFPIDEARYTSFENKYENTIFAADTAWNEFLQYHSSGCLLTIKTIPPCPNIPVTVANESYIPVTAVSAGALNYSYVTDDYGKAQVFLLPAYYAVNVTAYVSTGPGSRSAFIQWEDNETSNSRTLFVNGTTTLTAEYQPQYQLIVNANLGTTIPSVGAHWINSGSTVSIRTTAPPLAFSPTQERYVLLGWNGTGSGSYSGMVDSDNITMNGSINETVNWRHEYYLTVDSVYGLPTLSSAWIEAGTSILVSVTPPTSEPTDTRHVCTGWNGTGSVPASGTDTSANMSITQPSSITWNWKTQYRVYVNTDPAGLSPQPNASSTGWYDEGAALICTAQNVSGKVFDRWTLDSSSYEPGVNFINITVYGSHTAVAHYLPAPAWWNSLFAPANMPFVLALFAALTGSLVGGVWVITRRNRIKKTYPHLAPVTIPKVTIANRISTGCEAVDNLLYGGIPKGYSVALAAPSCDERDSLIKGFLEAGAKRGEATFHVTIDPAELASVAKEHQSNFYLFVCSPRADTMIENLPNIFKLKGAENLTEISIALAKAFRALDAVQNVPRRACIEIISDVLLQHHALQTRRWLTDLLPEFRSKGFTTLAVVNPQMHPQEEVQAILDLFEGQIAIFEKDTETGPLKFVRVKKMTNQKYSDCELPLNKESLETHDRQKDNAR